MPTLVESFRRRGRDPACPLRTPTWKVWCLTCSPRRARMTRKSLDPHPSSLDVPDLPANGHKRKQDLPLHRYSVAAPRRARAACYGRTPSTFSWCSSVEHVVISGRCRDGGMPYTHLDFKPPNSRCPCNRTLRSERRSKAPAPRVLCAGRPGEVGRRVGFHISKPERHSYTAARPAGCPGCRDAHVSWSITSTTLPTGRRTFLDRAIRRGLACSVTRRILRAPSVGAVWSRKPPCVPGPRRETSEAVDDQRARHYSLAHHVGRGPAPQCFWVMQAHVDQMTSLRPAPGGTPPEPEAPAARSPPPGPNQRGQAAIAASSWNSTVAGRRRRTTPGPPTPVPSPSDRPCGANIAAPPPSFAPPFEHVGRQPA